MIGILFGGIMNISSYKGTQKKSPSAKDERGPLLKGVLS